MGTGKELVRLTECGYWKELISKDVDSYTFFDRDNEIIPIEDCRKQYFCRISIKLKNKKFTRKYVTLLSEFCRTIASTNSEQMCVKIIKKKYYFIDIN